MSEDEMGKSAPDTPAERTAILPAVRTALAEADRKAERRDIANEALALRYAELMDEASVMQKYVRALEMVREAVEHAAADWPVTRADQLVTAFSRIEAALAEHSVASDLGPKLLAVLTALEVTPAARKQATGARASAPVTPISKSPLEAARDRARARNRGA